MAAHTVVVVVMVQGKAGVNTFGNAVDVGFMDPEKAVPGDLGFDPLGFADNGINPDYALSEIKHARLAVSPRHHLSTPFHGVEASRLTVLGRWLVYADDRRGGHAPPGVPAGQGHHRPDCCLGHELVLNPPRSPLLFTRSLEFDPGGDGPWVIVRPPLRLVKYCCSGILVGRNGVSALTGSVRAELLSSKCLRCL
jgi:hypothetical protein